jgi:hypothetical protein
MGEITNLNKATSKNESLRTTVPRSIIKQYKLTENDQLDWALKAECGDLLIHVIPRKVMHGRLIELPINKKLVLHLDDDKGVGFPIEEIVSQMGATLDKDSFKQKYLGKVITITLWKEEGKSNFIVEENK